MFVFKIPSFPKSSLPASLLASLHVCLAKSFPPVSVLPVYGKSRSLRGHSGRCAVIVCVSVDVGPGRWHWELRASQMSHSWMPEGLECCFGFLLGKNEQELSPPVVLVRGSATARSEKSFQKNPT